MLKGLARKGMSKEEWKNAFYEYGMKTYEKQGIDDGTIALEVLE